MRCAAFHESVFSANRLPSVVVNYYPYKKANERKIWVAKDGICRQVKTQEIHVGNIVWLHENDEIPSDLVLIGTSDPQGICYVEALAVFPITVHAYADEKSDMEELSMVALSGCIWLQAFVLTLDTNSFTYPQIILIWGNFVAFYVINLILNVVPVVQMHNVMLRLCNQPSYWITMALIVTVGMGPGLALRYLRKVFRPSAIDVLQQIEQTNGDIQTSRNMESSSGTYLDHLLTDLRRNKGSIHQPLLSDSVASST